MLIPKKVKHRKWQTNRTDMSKVTPDTRGVTVAFGSFGLKATAGGRVRSNQIESARKAASRAIGKTGRMWIRVFPDRPFTQKPAEVGMGKGKGNPEGYCLDVRPGRVLFEVDGVPEATAKEALRKAGTKLPVTTRVVAR
ncbi:MAG: 50S ribosomal protein L16 [Candidatus Paceibacterota bacterium]